MFELHHGEALAVLSTLPDASIDMALLDLPFGTTQNNWDSIIPMRSHIIYGEAKLTRDEFFLVAHRDGIPYDEAWRTWNANATMGMWEHLQRIVKRHGAIVCFAQDPFSSLLVASNFDGYKHGWTWSKKQSGNFAVAKYQPMSVTEDIKVFTGSGERVNYYPKMRKGKMRWRGSKNSTNHGRGFGGMKQVYYQSDEYYPTNLLENFPAVPRKHSLHPSQKPTGLLKYLIETYSLKGETVIDFTMGSGSAGVAALMAERRFVGCELYPLSHREISDDNPDTFGLAQRRIEHFAATGCDMLSNDEALPLFADA